MKEKVKEWLEAARLDCEAALALLDNEELTPIISFHSHQCIEKCFKAIIEDSDNERLNIRVSYPTGELRSWNTIKTKWTK